MNILDALILGIVEGITEFLPISSTGHLILASKLLKLPDSEFLKTFEIAIQLGAIFSVVILYWKTLVINSAVFKRVMAAFLPTAIIGFVLYKIIKKFLLGNELVVLIALAVGGVLLIIFELFHREKDDAHGDLTTLTYTKAVLVGVFQSLSVIPGVSRAAATILGGLLLDMKRKTIVEFSFLLAVPTMLAATVLDLIQSAGSFSGKQFGALSVGFVSSFVVAILAIKFLLHFIQKHSFITFGVYRIIAAFVFWWILK